MDFCEFSCKAYSVPAVVLNILVERQEVNIVLRPPHPDLLWILHAQHLHRRNLNVLNLPAATRQITDSGLESRRYGTGGKKRKWEEVKETGEKIFSQLSAAQQRPANNI